ncbi:MAG: hypothetical protein ACYTHJ_07415 [Planctomycetota bacterium]|jgi:hypothetical protein
MHKRIYSYLLLIGAVFLPGCGAVQELIVDEVRTTAKTSIEETIDVAVDGTFDALSDFGGLGDDEQSDD